MNQADVLSLSVVVSVVAAVISAYSYLLNRKLQRLSTYAKLMDRLYELDKLILQYPEVMAVFIKEAKRTDAFFYAPESVVPRDVMYVKLKAFAYFILNWHEEIFLILQHKSYSAEIQGQLWLDCIIQRMSHPLLREVFNKEADRIYTTKFANYIRSRAKEIHQPCDPDIW